MPAASPFDDVESCSAPSETGAQWMNVFPLWGKTRQLRFHSLEVWQVWLREGGATPSPPLSLHSIQFSRPKCWPAQITRNIYLSPGPFFPFCCPCCLPLQPKKILKKLDYPSLRFSFSLSFLCECSCLSKLFECSCLLGLSVCCVNGTQPRVLESKSDSLIWTLCGSFSSGLSARCD